jgi:hypothetical protein
MDFDWTVPWEGDAELRTLVFEDETARWIFKHRYVKRVDLREVQLLNDTTLTVEYTDGEASAMNLTMHVVIPARLGQKYLFGMDISPGAKTFLEFSYELRSGSFQLTEITKGASTRLSLDSPGLTKGIKFPFPVPGGVEEEDGKFNVSYLRSGALLGKFTFPRSIVRRSSR